MVQVIISSKDISCSSIPTPNPILTKLIMSYFNYHAKAKKLIKDSLLVRYEFVDNWNGIKPALVLYFKDVNPMPIREYRWEEYLPLINNQD